MYNHKEAFCQMLYQCEDCRCMEVLWNSRDGVTPFVIDCQQCKGGMQHVHWQLDVCLPDFNPPVGSRIFKTMLWEEAREIARRRLEYLANESLHYGYVPKPGDKDYEDTLQQTACDIYHDGTAPMIEVVKENQDEKI